MPSPSCPACELDPATVRTNIVVLRLTPEMFGGTRPPEGLATAFLARLKEQGVLISQVSHDLVRMVTHRDAGRADVETAIARLRQVAGAALPVAG